MQPYSFWKVASSFLVFDFGLSDAVGISMHLQSTSTVIGICTSSRDLLLDL
eukprot:COSAG02_NODE_1939_length_10312_cov_14.320866_5_plen_51_part_00